MQQQKKHYEIHTGIEAISTDVPEIDYIIEQKLRRLAKVSVIGKWKVAKSYFTIQAGIAIAAGADFLGFRTTQANVLYVNFEVSKEMFQQRVQHIHHVLGCDLARFRYTTITDLSLDQHTRELDEILTQCIEDGFPVEVLVLDPRWKAIKRDSNQDEVLNAFCVNLDKIIERYKVTLIIVHHEGASTASDKAGKGSTVFEAWLDGWFKIKKQTQDEKGREIDIWSRDCEREWIGATFDYPIFKVAPDLVTERKAKTDKAKRCIMEFLRQKGDMPEKEVRFYVLEKGHSDYAFWRGRKELLEDGQVTIEKAPGPGNRKMLCLVDKTVPDTLDVEQTCGSTRTILDEK